MGKCFNWNECRVKWSAVFAWYCSHFLLINSQRKEYKSVSITFGASHKSEYFKRKNRIFSSFFSPQCHLFILSFITNGTRKKETNKNKTTNPDFQRNRSNKKYAASVSMWYARRYYFIYISPHTFSLSLSLRNIQYSLFISFRTA